MESDTGTSHNGTAYVFIYSGGAWTTQAKLLASDKAGSDLFGRAVSLNTNADTTLVGAYLEDDSGTTSNGAAYVFTRSGSTWTAQTKLLASDKADSDVFGVSVALSSNGNLALIGAFQEDDSGLSDNGAAYTFSRSGSVWTQLSKFLASDKATSDYFGRSVAVAGDGNIVLVGADQHDEGSFSNSGAAYIFAKGGVFSAGIGCYDTTSYSFFLRNALSAGAADFTISGYGSLPGDIPLAGDWNDDNIDTIGLYRCATGEFFLRDSNTLGAPDHTLVLGNPDDTPLHGHWSDDTVGDGVGVFRPSNGILYLKKQLTTGFSDYFLIMGNPSDVGISGDWDGDGIDSPGIYRVDEGKFYLTNLVTNGIVFASTIFPYGSGTSGAANPYVDIPVPGDWNGDGTTTAGVYNSQTGTFYLRNANSAGISDYAFVFCSPGTLPIAGHWSN